MATDLNGDGRDDLVVSQNNDQIVVLLQHPSEGGELLSVRLEGQAGNLQAVGARIVAVHTSGLQQVTEVYGGEGYLTQSPPLLHFAQSEEDPVAEIHTRWPDGSTSRIQVEAGTNSLKIKQ